MAKDEKQTVEVLQVNYEVLRHCYGFACVGSKKEPERQDVPESYYTRRWYKGEKITLPSDIKVPHHFHDLRNPSPQQAREKKRAINSRKVRRITRPDFQE